MGKHSSYLNDPLTVDDLISAYLRVKEWMDYDAERSAYSAMEIMAMQKLFGTSYVSVPSQLSNAPYDGIRSAMEQRLELVGRYIGAIDASVHGEQQDACEDTTALLEEIDKTSFMSSVDWCMTLHQAIQAAANSVEFGDSGDPSDYTIDTEPFEDCFSEVGDHEFDSIRAFIIDEHPGIDTLSFPRKALYELGLPRQAPEPINYNSPAQLN